MVQYWKRFYKSWRSCSYWFICSLKGMEQYRPMFYLQMKAFSAFSGSAHPEQHNRSWGSFENVNYTTTLLGNGLCPHLLPFHLFTLLTRKPYAYKYSLDRTTETHIHEARWIEWWLSHLSRKFGPNRHLKKWKCRQISLSSYLVVVSAVGFETSLVVWT